MHSFFLDHFWNLIMIVRWNIHKYRPWILLPLTPWWTSTMSYRHRHVFSFSSKIASEMAHKKRTIFTTISGVRNNLRDPHEYIYCTCKKPGVHPWTPISRKLWTRTQRFSVDLIRVRAIQSAWNWMTLTATATIPLEGLSTLLVSESRLVERSPISNTKCASNVYSGTSKIQV